MKIIFLILLLALAFGYGCRPNKNTPIPLANGYSGRLYAHKDTHYGPGLDNALTYAEFFKQPTDLYTSGDKNRVAINNVRSNGTYLGEMRSGQGANNQITEWWYEGTASNANNGMEWQVDGKNGIPSFTWVDTGAMPDFIGKLPDSISLNQGISFIYSPAQFPNADSVAIWFEAVSTIKGSRLPCSITFSPAELKLTHGNIVSMFVWFGKCATQTFGGKKFASIKTAQIEKTVVFY